MPVCLALLRPAAAEARTCEQTSKIIAQLISRFAWSYLLLMVNALDRPSCLLTCTQPRPQNGHVQLLGGGLGRGSIERRCAWLRRHWCYMERSCSSMRFSCSVEPKAKLSGP